MSDLTTDTSAITAALTKNLEGFEPSLEASQVGHIIEVGAVVITEDRRIVSPISFLVRQPREHLESWQAQRAMKVHGIPVETVLRDGLDPEAAATRFIDWIARVVERHGVREIRAFNQEFDFWFLEQSPWDLFTRSGLVPGEDVQLTARKTLGGGRGPSLARSVLAAQERGADFEWQSRAHRAEEDARVAAEVALFFGKA